MPLAPSDSWLHGKRNTMIFIRPDIISNRKVMNHITRTKYDYIREKQVQRRLGAQLITRRDRTPLMPPFKKPRQHLPNPFAGS